MGLSVILVTAINAVVPVVLLILLGYILKEKGFFTQDFVKIGELFEKHFRAIAPKSVKVNVKFLHGGAPYVSPTDMTAYKAAEQAIIDTFGKKPLPFYSGGSIPIISGFERILGIKSILIGFGLSEDAIHSPNESYGLEQFDKGVRTIPLFYKHFAQM